MSGALLHRVIMTHRPTITCYFWGMTHHPTITCYFWGMTHLPTITCYLRIVDLNSAILVFF